MFSHLSQSSLHSRSRQRVNRVPPYEGNQTTNHANGGNETHRKGRSRRTSGASRSVVSCATAVPSMRVKNTSGLNYLVPPASGVTGLSPLSQKLLSKSVPRGIHHRTDSDMISEVTIDSSTSQSHYSLRGGSSAAAKAMRAVTEEGNSSPENNDDEEEEREGGEDSDNSDEEICQPCCRPGRSGVITWIKNMVIHKLQDTPPWYMLILLALQFLFLKLMTCFVLYNVIQVTFRLEGEPKLCGQIFSGTLFISGVSVILQLFVGVRLPMVQGLTLATMIYFNTNGVANISNKKTPFENWATFASGMSFVSMLFGAFQMLIGFSGLSGIIMRFIGPLTVSPLMVMYAIFLCPVTVAFFEKQWIMTVIHLGLSATFLCILGVVRVPFCSSGPRARCRLIGYPLFRVLGFFLATVIAILVDAFLNDIIPPSDTVFLNKSSGASSSMQWAYLPIPLVFGYPQVQWIRLGKYLPIAFTLSLKSINDYFATARNCRVSPPPSHAINRGQFIEGLCSLIAGCLGLPPVSTDSGHIGMSTLANVASRSVMAVTGGLLLVLSLVPRPAFYLTYFLGRYSGSILVFYVALTTASGLSNLYFVNMISTRNQFVVGFSIVLGYMIPRLIPASSSVQADILILFNPIVLAGAVGFILDLLFPIKYDDNGRIAWVMDESRFSRHFGKLKMNTGRAFLYENPKTNLYHNRPVDNDKMSLVTDAQVVKRSQMNMYVGRAQRTDVSIYDLPFVTTDTLLEHPWTTRIPILPSFKGHITWIQKGGEETMTAFISVSERNLHELV